MPSPPIRAPIRERVTGLRQRLRADGTWRIWWEPSRGARKLGAEPVDLSADKLTWSINRAKQLNDQMNRARGAQGATPQGRTITNLIEAYKTSPKFKKFAAGTRRDYQQAFGVIQSKWGHSRVADLDKPTMFTWYETMFHTNGEWAAKSYIAKMRLLMTYAENRGWRADNPCLRLGVISPAPRERVVSWDEQDLLVATADAMGLPSMATAILIAALQGQRETDIIKLQPQRIRGGGLTLRQSKRGTSISMKLHPETAARLARMPAAAPAVCIYEGTNRPYSGVEQFSKVFARVRARAAKTDPTVADIVFRDLRRTFSTRAAIGGADAKQRGDALGNQIATNPSLELTYNPAQSAAADAAVDAIKRPEKRKKA